MTDAPAPACLDDYHTEMAAAEMAKTAALLAQAAEEARKAAIAFANGAATDAAGRRLAVDCHRQSFAAVGLARQRQLTVEDHIELTKWGRSLNTAVQTAAAERGTSAPRAHRI